ncbi:phage tail tip fiber protein [Larsenimonas suaedae]|uniref:Tip attachment protein J central straight fiber domain-containing protein n=1 Tax=Larsenimonas suaedae TaxID=1851019 RepID=A0ABU1GZ81_9GAMM|nr:hypothetical protein [Larsenimonas suaedae]MCM2973794.1 hypothetical protein [Larsenimonas suaedae]MDR5897318.1 hypothetical protein [Larsenimonas suaedae]
MACSNMVCGTGGGYSGPKEGDPDNSAVLTATPAFGGVDVEWTYPEINPHAVAHTRLYRSTSGTDADPLLYKIVSGGYFFDRTTTATAIEYFYWIEIVSINGTVGERIGPASATARPTIQQMLEMLTGQIDSGVLAEALKGSIDQITLNRLGIDQEAIERAKNDDALGVSFNEVQAHSDETRALLQEETKARTTSDSAFVESVNTVYAEMETQSQTLTAAIQEEKQARTDADGAMAKQLDTVQARIDDDIASVQTQMKADIKKVGDTITDIGALYTAKVDVNGMVGGFGVYNDGKTVEAGFDVDRFWVGRSSQDKVKPFIIEGGETFIDDAVIRKLTFNKLRADDGSLAFSGGKLKAEHIDVANLRVREAASFSGDVFSDGFISGSRGWCILQSGYTEFNDATIRGNLEIKTLTVNGNSPYGAIKVDKYQNWGDVTVNSSTQYFTTGWGYDSVSEMPENGRVSLRGNARANVNIVGTVGGTKSTWGGAHNEWTTTRYSGTVTIRVRANILVQVDGVTVINKTGTIDTKTATGRYTYSMNFSGTVTGDGEYTYPAYRSSSSIRARTRIYIDVLVQDKGTTGLGYEPNTIEAGGTNIATGEVSRLG